MNAYPSVPCLPWENTNRTLSKRMPLSSRKADPATFAPLLFLLHFVISALPGYEMAGVAGCP